MTIEQRRCFILMPFLPELKYMYLYLKDHIEDRHNLLCERGDSDYNQSGILDKIERYIRNADILIADCTYPFTPPPSGRGVVGREDLDMAGVYYLSPLPTSPRWGEGSERLRRDGLYAIPAHRFAVPSNAENNRSTPSRLHF